jgi:NAD(P)-dependent dehydrogenase (short-subunit alcohol dehydrogenase family)
MDLGLTGKRALVTGGSRGIGLAVARSLAAEGADVALIARGAEAVGRAAADLARESGRTVIGVAADTGDDASVTAAVATIVERLGGVDILVNAAATPNTGKPLQEDALEAEINVKVRGYLRTARAVAPLMVAEGWGRIINISGIAARQTGTVVGSVRNVAVAAMSKNLADELGSQGVNVTVVHPGMTRTERALDPALERTVAAGVSIGRIVDAEEVADVVAFLASPRSVALNGDPVVASGGARGPIYY